MSRFKRIKNKTTKKSSVSIDEKIAALNKELEKTGMLSERMTTSNVYSTSTNVPADPGGTFPVPDPNGVTQTGFTPPVSGNPDDPSNWPDAYTDNSWMFNPNEVDGESNRPVVTTMDQGVLAAYNAANPGNTNFPTGGAGIVFGSSGFGTGVGYAKNGHFYQVLNPGLFGDGSTKIVPPGSPFGAPWFGLFGMYFPATPELAAVIMAMSGAYAAAGGFTKDPDKVMPIPLWRNHNLFHDGPFNDYGGKKYTDSEGRNYLLQTFFMHRAGNTYFVNPTPESQTNVQTRGTEDPPIYPGPIASLFGLGARAFEWLKDKAQGVGEKVGEIASEIKTNVEEFIEQGIEIVSETIDINNNGEVDWNDMGRWVNEAIKSQTSDKFNLITAPLWEALPDKGQEWVEENLENVNRTILNEINKIQQKFTGDDMQTPLNWIYKFNETAQQNPFEKYDGEVDMTDATDIDTQIDLSERTIGTPEVQNLVEKIKGVKGKNVPLTEQQKESLETLKRSGIDISGIENQEDFYKVLLKSKFDTLIGSHEDPGGAIAANEALKNTFGGRPGSWTTEEDIDNFIETGELNVHKGIQSEEAGYQFRQDTVDLPGWMDFMTGVADINPDTVGSGSLVNFLGAMAVGKLGLNPRLPEDSTGSQSQDLEETPPVPWVYTIKPVETILQENFLHNSPNFLLESRIRTQKRKEQTSKFGLEIGGFDGNMRPLTGKRKKNFNLVIPKKHRHKFNKKKSGSLKESLNENVRLGHFEPEQLNVDIEDLRKGIMPEYPKNPPAEMIDGYHEKSRIRSKNAKNEEPYLKIDKTDLIRNHRLKSSEADEMMDTINMINDYIKKHPEDLIHAQMRYPVDDPRLAELNWKMDQMLEAGSKYMDSNFKENKKLFKRAVDRTKNNIKLTDPEYVQQNYNELRGTTQGKVINPKPRDIKLKSKLKKHLPQYESKSFFKHVDSNDYKKISERKEEQKRLKLENETALNKVTKERQEYIDGEMLKQMSDWRQDILE